MDVSENWEPATLTLRSSGFQVMIDMTGTIQIAEKFSEDLSVCTTVSFQAISSVVIIVAE